MREVKGYTLVEACATLAVFGILAATAGYSMSDWLNRSNPQHDARQLYTLLQHARQLAITSNHLVLVCPLRENGSCSRDWNNNIATFIDYNHNAKRDSDEHLARQWLAANRNSQIYFRAFGNSRVRFEPTGWSNNGSFSVCPANNDLSRARQVVISRTGRVYHARDKDGDGVVANSLGQPPRCD